jgi:hypothetical protein
MQLNAARQLLSVCNGDFFGMHVKQSGEAAQELAKSECMLQSGLLFCFLSRYNRPV